MVRFLFKWISYHRNSFLINIVVHICVFSNPCFWWLFVIGIKLVSFVSFDLWVTLTLWILLFWLVSDYLFYPDLDLFFLWWVVYSFKNEFSYFNRDSFALSDISLSWSLIFCFHLFTSISFEDFAYKVSFNSCHTCLWLVDSC